MSFHASSKVITLAHALWLTDETKNNMNNPFIAATSIFVMTFKGLIVSGTADVVRANQQ